MNSIESLIKTKLNIALSEEKKRVASNLLGEQTTPGTVGGPIGQPSNNNTGKSNNASRKQDKTDQIGELRQKIALLNTQASKAKDPNAMKMKLKIMSDKLKVAQDELIAIK